MDFSEDILRQAHKHSSLHKEEVLKSDICGCFYCMKISKPTDILDWVDTENPDEPTALCPICGIDSLIGSASGFPVDNEDFLKAMNNFWF